MHLFRCGFIGGEYGWTSSKFPTCSPQNLKLVGGGNGIELKLDGGLADDGGIEMDDGGCIKLDGGGGLSLELDSGDGGRLDGGGGGL